MHWDCKPRHTYQGVCACAIKCSGAYFCVSMLNKWHVNTVVLRIIMDKRLHGFYRYPSLEPNYNHISLSTFLYSNGMLCFFSCSVW